MLNRLLARLPFTFLALAFLCGYSALEQQRRVGLDGKAVAFAAAAVLAVVAGAYGLSQRHRAILRHDGLMDSDRGVR